MFLTVKILAPCFKSTAPPPLMMSPRLWKQSRSRAHTGMSRNSKWILRRTAATHSQISLHLVPGHSWILHYEHFIDALRFRARGPAVPLPPPPPSNGRLYSYLPSRREWNPLVLRAEWVCLFLKPSHASFTHCLQSVTSLSPRVGTHEITITVLSGQPFLMTNRRFVHTAFSLIAVCVCVCSVSPPLAILAHAFMQEKRGNCPCNAIN